MKLYTYVVASDTGFAPNPLGNFCSLACCKPVIRRTAKKGDWIIGIGSINNVGNKRIIYAMKVSEKISFDEYYHDKRFKNRIDNIYHKEDGKWKQKSNPFHDKDDIDHDTKTEHILISDYYFYFGKDAVDIPDDFQEFIKGGRGHRTSYPEDFVQKLINWLKKTYPPGVHSKPFDYVEEIWKTNGCKNF